MYKMEVYQKEEATAIGSLTAKIGTGKKKLIGYFAGFMAAKAERLGG